MSFAAKTNTVIDSAVGGRFDNGQFHSLLESGVAASSQINSVFRDIFDAEDGGLFFGTNVGLGGGLLRCRLFFLRWNGSRWSCFRWWLLRMCAKFGGVSSEQSNLHQRHRGRAYERDR